MLFVEPTDPFQGREFGIFDTAQGRACFDELVPLERLHYFRECIVIGVTDGAGLRVDA